MSALSIGLVLALERANSAPEYQFDHLHPDLALEIGAAKDSAAAAVLVASLAAASVEVSMLLAATSGSLRPAVPYRRWNDYPVLLALIAGPMGRPIIFRGEK